MHLFIDSEVCTYSGVMQFNAMHSMMIIVHTCTLESYIQIAKNLGLFITLVLSREDARGGAGGAQFT